jgi:hypothetical protein
MKHATAEVLELSLDNFKIYTKTKAYKTYGRSVLGLLLCMGVGDALDVSRHMLSPSSGSKAGEFMCVL